MVRTKWKSHLIIAVGFICLYLLIRVRNYNYRASMVLRNTHPSDAWEFVADFSNMKYLNPTIDNFNIIAESGNYDHWKYSTEYSEHLSHWPYLPNHAVAHFEIKASPQKDAYYIHSTHTTCLFYGYFCLDSKSEFKFGHDNTWSTSDAFCEEKVAYQCPAFLSSFCRREVIYQRNAIMSNLKKHFLTHGKRNKAN